MLLLHPFPFNLSRYFHHSSVHLLDVNALDIVVAYFSARKVIHLTACGVGVMYRADGTFTIACGNHKFSRRLGLLAVVYSLHCEAIFG